MPTTPHIEHHFTAGDTVRDIVIGMSDGLTVPFALAAGLTGAIAASKLVVTAGLAEVAAGSIAMGLGGFLAARGDAEHYAAERRREALEVVEKPDVERAEVRAIFLEFGLDEEQAEIATEALAKNPDRWIDFMMRFELGLEEPDASRAWKSASTIAGAYVAGGLLPLCPYMMLSNARHALPVSAAITLVALFVFGFVKGRFVGTNVLKSGVQTVVVGGLAATTAFIIARLIGG